MNGGYGMQLKLQKYEQVRAAPAAITLLALLAIVQTATFAENEEKNASPQTIEFYFVYLPGLLEQDGKTGAIAEVIHEIGNRADITFVMRNIPMRRQDRALLGNQVIVAGPELDRLNAPETDITLRTSLPIAYRRDFAFVRKGTPIPTTIEATQAMKLVTSPATSLPPPIEQLHGLSILETHSDQSAITLLSKGRVNLWINDETTALAALANSDASNIIYDPDRPLHEWPARIVFSKASDDALVDKINAAIQSMIDDGTMNQLLPNNYAEQASRQTAGTPAAE